MIRLTLEQADALTRAQTALRLYALLLARFDRGEPTFRPDEFGKRPATTRDAMRALEQAGWARFPAAGRGAYRFQPAGNDLAEMVHAVLKANGQVAKWPDLTVEAIAELRRAFPGADLDFGPRLAGVLAAASAAGDIDRILPYAAKSLAAASATTTKAKAPEKESTWKPTIQPGPAIEKPWLIR